MNENQIFKDYPDVVSIEQLMKMLGIGRNKAYELVNSGTIKSIRIGTKHKIPKVRVVEFLMQSI